jgi:hypothetical protein
LRELNAVISATLLNVNLLAITKSDLNSGNILIVVASAESSGFAVDSATRLKDTLLRPLEDAGSDSVRSVFDLVVCVKDTSLETLAETPTSMMGILASMLTEKPTFVPKADSVPCEIVMDVLFVSPFLNKYVLFAPFVLEFFINTSDKIIFLTPLLRIVRLAAHSFQYVRVL